mgnify:CR=1 FL=1
MFKENENTDKTNDFFRESVINEDNNNAEPSADSLDTTLPLQDEVPPKEDAEPKQEDVTSYVPPVSDSLIFSRDVQYDNPYIK